MYFKTKNAGEFHSASSYRKEARAQLEGHWKEAVLLSVIPTLVFLAFGITVAFSIYKFGGADYTTIQEGAGSNSNSTDIFINSASTFLSLSISFSMLKMVRHLKTNLEWKTDIFYIFKLPFFWKLLLLEIVKNIFIALWTLVFFIPGLIKGYSYSQASYIYYDEMMKNPDSNMKVTDAITASRMMMKGRKMDKFLLDLSFIGWYLLSLLTLGLGMFVVKPYFEMSSVIFYENARLSLPHTDLSNQEIHEMYQRKMAEEEGPIVGEDPDDFSDF